MFKPLTEAEKDYSYSVGFLEEWLKTAPDQVKESLAVVKAAISGYREKYLAAQEDYNKLNDLYIKLTGLAAGYFDTMRQQKEQMDQMLIDQQREFHKEPLIET